MCCKSIKVWWSSLLEHCPQKEKKEKKEKGKKTAQKKEKKKKNVLVSKYYNKENSFPLYIREGEKDLSIRLLKAFKHLNSFCSNKKETF